MPIKLFDSLTREVRELKPSHKDGVFRFYNCGPTVYAAAHIGNFRTFLVNDVLRRVLDLEFGVAKVKHVRNLTDVDDKTIKRAREEKKTLAEVTQEWTKKFHADCAALNCLAPHVEPTATGHLQEQIDMIELLMKNNHAYRAPDGSVYFKVSSFSEYGKLSRVKVRELQPGATVKTAAADADEKEDGSDFALWKAWKPDDGPNKWRGPKSAAEGRPGWHIECSAMSKKHLGETIDLHTGGVDLLFPHHENEIAQSECCNGRPFSVHWYHSEHLLVDGKKMSKSLGNMYTLNDLVEKGYSPMAVRYALLAGHPRKQLNFTLESLHAAESAMTRLDYHIDRILAHAKLTREHWPAYIKPGPVTDEGLVDVLNSLRDDLNLPEAFGALFTYIGKIALPSSPTESSLNLLPQFGAVMYALGFHKTAVSAPPHVVAIADNRWAAKKAKDFALADKLRAELAAAGWIMLDSKDSYKLEPAKK